MSWSPVHCRHYPLTSFSSFSLFSTQVVIVLAGRYAGKKAVIVNHYDEGCVVQGAVADPSVPAG